ncbi:type II toxin-antitoxin system ParD family antitoxin [Leptolyngbya boryana CZ1]|uniref:Transcriptional regulators, CopG/Arc/MetJ family protein n=2 Tax=Leptolyngbya boryana TaxID=1184 RepID=A0A1Z4JCI4_LEPBY|nr:MULTISPECIES: type II toxin-antitoxin system ParD family antitoxin [Leptolyngbya]BAY54504.1 transcriptional regulators, CopG/Arc/MetJ family protein [Leptolyngbya boryana NIES-2135]ULP31429.1 type II toxin-antitoxin system ParD family antitoxin [Leptolyngbya boryana IU 594]WNZ43515.1 type II toxin-antitoxin system ParD family antitoxin [Leptolyngbya boryana CZ1]BAS59156.1 transcriptional regulators, CopG/Arc/MetJ family [Leptolyngbya boryana IAM M-101]BAS65504.1 transcriptional regulators, 
MALNSEQQEFIQARVESGQYKNADEVVDAAFKLLEKREQYDRWLKDAREDVQVGLAELHRGEGVDGEVVIAQLRDKIAKARGTRE